MSDTSAAKKSENDLGDQKSLHAIEKNPIREIIIAGMGFLLFMTLLTIGINAVGVDNLQRFIQDAGPFAPLLSISIKALTYVIAPLTSGPIQVVAGTLFDSVWLGVLYTLIGEVLGGSINFWIARRFGRPVVLRFVGQNGMKQVETFYQDRLGGWVSLAVARLILFSVWDFLSYALGLAKPVRFSTYILISIIFGFFPTLLFVWLGDVAIQDSRAMFMIYGFVAILILLPMLARRPMRRLLAWASGRKIKPSAD
ncbi:MAG: VTT domain-containing protein [Anaerolineae bacterium]|nr:VTT domain-containing protein [Anaerolineae bacterium]